MFLKKFFPLFSTPLSLKLYFFSFLCCICLRCFLEPFADNTILPFFRFLHYFSWFLNLSLLSSVIITIFTKNNFVSVLKFIFCVFCFLAVIPFIDLAFKSLQNNDLAYIYFSSVKDFIVQFFSLSWSNKTSLGQKIIGFYLIVYLFLYCKQFISLKKSILCMITLCFFGYCLGALPSFFVPIFHFFKLSFVSSDYLYLLLLLILLFPLLAVSLFLYNKKFFTALLKDLRPERILLGFIMFFIGQNIAIKLILLPEQNTINSTASIVSLIALFLTCLFSLLCNNIYDYEIDKISNTTRPLPQKTISLEKYIKMTKITGFLAFFYNLIVFQYAGLPLLALQALYIIYSCPPLRLKRFFWISRFLTSFAAVVIFLAGFSSVNLNPYSCPLIFLILIQIFFWLTIHFIDLKDFEGDKLNNIKTLPTIFGLQKSKVIISLFFVFAHILLAYSIFFVYGEFKLKLVFSILFTGILHALNILFTKNKSRELLGFSLYLFTMIRLLFLIATDF